MRTLAPAIGRLVGNWFATGTNGYGGLVQSTYWRGHFSLAPDLYDPTRDIASFGDLGGREGQFALRLGPPRPDEVEVATGPVRYELVAWEYAGPDGVRWNRESLVRGPRVVEQGAVRGCLLVEMLEARRMRAQPFVGQIGRAHV